MVMAGDFGRTRKIGQSSTNDAFATHRSKLTIGQARLLGDLRRTAVRGGRAIDKSDEIAHTDGAFPGRFVSSSAAIRS